MTIGRSLVAYAVFIAYGSLLPFEYRAVPLDVATHQFLSLRHLQLGVTARADLMANFVLYAPLGLLMAGWLTGKGAGLLRGVLAFTACAALAAGIEFTQIFFAPRTVSSNDLIAEFLGAGAGITLWVLGAEPLGRLGRALRLSGRPALIAALVAYALGYFALGLFPYDFLVSTEEIAWKLGTDRQHWLISARSCGGWSRCLGTLGSEWLGAIPLGALLGLIAVRLSARLTALVTTALAVGIAFEAVQFLLASGVSQGASVLARIGGILTGASVRWALLPSLLQRFERAPWRRVAVGLAAIGYAAVLIWVSWDGPQGWTGFRFGLERLGSTRFLPFYYHYFTSEPVAMRNLVLQVGAYLPLGLLGWLWNLPGSRFLRHSYLPGVVGPVVCVALVVEAGKLFLAGTHPDPTNVLVASVAAWIGFSVPRLFGMQARRDAPTAPVAREAERPPPTVAFGTRGPAQFATLALGIALLLGIAWHLRNPPETLADESTMPTFPHPHDLPPVSLLDFKRAHPRLPHPTPADIEAITTTNPRYVKSLRNRARGGAGNLDASIQLAYFEPGSIDMDALYRRLLGLKATWRGHEQVKPQALAYDWLHAQWTPAQREALLEKLIADCNYIIGVIRNERLSPYNVYLYNSPLQALVACALASYTDAPAADAVMRFTYDFWKNRTLPVWRQVMGTTGGWHEGSQYVGIGIGQAIYQIPAMWRAATGEDHLGEPGIRGFLDFLVYRTRPDGIHVRWGDSSFFEKGEPDRLALAVEHGHKSAYSLRACPPRVQPTAWPWGPLPMAALCDRNAREQLPLTRRFDGIGLLVARSDWSADATYVNFKAGDNYWSHSHLDQGAFTIYKGGALALDSGLYGVRYASDFHMNYSYQTIAHNVVTVTDPDDAVPVPGNNERPARPIANDGGQRRIGSGWGIEPAPLDLAEWNRKREIYHTATLLDFVDRDGVVTVTADLTPAYTNSLSGKGTFSHRTRRVERYLRSFSYDRVNDVIVVYDRLRVTDPAFTVRWLLHTLEAPERTPDGFRVRVAGTKQPGHAGGELTAHVLRPAEAEVVLVGGPGHEFEVDGRNFTEHGAVYARAKALKNAEPGAWRVELIPKAGAQEITFLVVLVPRLAGEAAELTVTPVAQGTRTGCIVTGRRRTEWLADAGRGLRAETQSAPAGRAP